MKSRYLVLCAVFVFCVSTARAEQPVAEHPYPSLTYQYERQTEPLPQKIFVAKIDLADPQVQVRVSRGGPDPDGAGKWETTLMQPTKVADREGFDVVINGDFFTHLSGHDAEGAAALKEFKSGIPADVDGPAMTDGKLWATPKKKRAAFMIDHAKHPSIAELKTPPSSAYQVVAGSDILVKNGKDVAPPPDKSAFSRGPHPRTAIGISQNGKTLILVVVDGRKHDAHGMSLEQLAQVMLKYGSYNAMNLDGGGSSVLAIRDPKTHKMKIMNTPSDGRERAVGDVLGVRLTERPAEKN